MAGLFDEQYPVLPLAGAGPDRSGLFAEAFAGYQPPAPDYVGQVAARVRGLLGLLQPSQWQEQLGPAAWEALAPQLEQRAARAQAPGESPGYQEMMDLALNFGPGPMGLLGQIVHHGGPRNEMGRRLAKEQGLLPEIPEAAMAQKGVMPKVEAYDGPVTYRADPDEYVYHVTTEPKAKQILKNGFDPRAAKTVKGGFYENYSKGKVFFTDKDGLGFWRDRIEEHLDQAMDNPPALTVLRVRKSDLPNLKPDEVGTKDAMAASWFLDSDAPKGLLPETIPDELPSWAPAERMAQWRTARANAALPVEQGGLGLGPANTAAERAKAGGYYDAWHGSNRVVDPTFDLSMLGENTRAQSARAAIFAAGDRSTPNAYIWAPSEVAFDSFGAMTKGDLSVQRMTDLNRQMKEDINRYKDALDKHPGKPKPLLFSVDKRSPEDIADYQRLRELDDAARQYPGFNYRSWTATTADDPALDADIDVRKWVPFSKVTGAEHAPNIMPLKIRADDLPQHMQQYSQERDISYAELIDYATKGGAEGMVIKNTMDGSINIPTTIYAITNPARIRSRFAAFDPMRRNEADLLASWLLPLVLGAGAASYGLLGQPPVD